MQHQDQHEEESQKYKSNSQSLSRYKVTLSSGEELGILAADSMDAAYLALELSEDKNTKLLNVRIIDEQQS